jgi:uncharacterized protein
MKIYIRELSDKQKKYEYECDPKVLCLGTESLRHSGPVKVKAFAVKTLREVLIKYEFNCIIESECVRCLEKFKSKNKNSGIISYSVKKEDEFIDIKERIREEIILNYPAKPLCREDCRGLCLSCGINLNKFKCKCNNEEKICGPFSDLTLK